MDGKRKFTVPDETRRINAEVMAFRFGEKWFPMLSVEAYGCAITKERRDLWQKVSADGPVGEMAGKAGNYMKLREDPESAYSPEMIDVVCCGEDTGCLGYVPSEQTDAVRSFAHMVDRNLTELHVMAVARPERSQKTIQLIIWP